MKRALLLVVTMCAVSFFVSAQAPAARSAQASPEEATLMQIERDWGNALVKADTAALDRILAADYVSTSEDGQMQTKAQELANFKSGQRKFESFTINEMKVRILGDAAIVHGMSTDKSNYKGKDTSGQYRWTDVFAKRGGRWQAVATHVSKVAKP